jgi:hypothetical protein
MVTLRDGRITSQPATDTALNEQLRSTRKRPLEEQKKAAPRSIKKSKRLNMVPDKRHTLEEVFKHIVDDSEHAALEDKQEDGIDKAQPDAVVDDAEKSPLKDMMWTSNASLDGEVRGTQRGKAKADVIQNQDQGKFPNQNWAEMSENHHEEKIISSKHGSYIRFGSESPSPVCNDQLASEQQGYGAIVLDSDSSSEVDSDEEGPEAISQKRALANVTATEADIETTLQKQVPFP